MTELAYDFTCLWGKKKDDLQLVDVAEDLISRHSSGRSLFGLYSDS